MIYEKLNASFGLAGQIEFAQGKGGLAFAHMSNACGTATICLQGAHCTSFVPRGHTPVLWMSDKALFEHAKPIRGGIPVMWPWFGPAAQAEGNAPTANLPQHGFARTLQWEPLASTSNSDGSTTLVLGVSDSVVTRSLWNHCFTLVLAITVGNSLELSLTAQNTGTAAVVTGGGFHPYFKTGDINRVSVRGLSGCQYLDNLKGMRQYPQDGDLRFRKEIDRVFLDTGNDVVVKDPGAERTLRISKSGSRTTVVWNPWQDKARKMADFSDNGYLEMLCVEAVNALGDTVTLEPGESHTISQTISIE